MPKRPDHFLKLVDPLFVRTCAQPGAGAGNGYLQTSRFKWLGYIVDGMRIKGTLRLMIECGHEYRYRRRRAKPLEKIEAGSAR